MEILPQQAITQELTSSERLLWAGQPAGGIRFRGSDVFAIPFSLLWGGFAVFWEASVVKQGSMFMTAWGLPFLAVAIYITVGRFFVDAYIRRNTVYGLTSQRVIIRSGLFGSRLTSLQLRTLGEVSLSERGDGSGTITLGTNSGLGFMGGFSWMGRSRFQPPALEMIPQVRSVYNQLRGAQVDA